MEKTYSYNMDDGDFEYQVSYSEIKEALGYIICDEYFSHKGERSDFAKIITSFIDDCDLYHSLSDKYEEELKDYFADRANREWRRCR